MLRAFPSHPEIVQPDGELDREALAHLVFADPAARRRLNGATHLPVLLELVRQAARQWMAFQPTVVIDMPLLFETGFFRATGENVLVACSPGVQLRRLMARDGVRPEAAAARVAAQMPLEQKRKLADVVLENDGGVEELQRQVQELAGGRLRRRRWLHCTLLSPAGAAVAAALLLKLMQ